MNREYLRNLVLTLEKGQGKAFVEDLYQFLKEQHSMEETQLPPDLRRCY
jgi:polyhydroxyalkanoate synthesis regulator phasin